MSGYSLPRVQFDYMMFKKATEIVKENGGAVIQGFTVKEILSETAGGITVIKGVSGKFGGSRSDSPVLSFESLVTIGAGGYNLPSIQKNN